MCPFERLLQIIILSAQVTEEWLVLQVFNTSVWTVMCAVPMGSAHSAGTHESFWCNVRLRNCFHVVYWTAEPSYKQIIFFIRWLMLPFKESCWISLEKMTLFSAVWNNCQISMFFIHLHNHCTHRSLSSLADLCFLLRKVTDYYWKRLMCCR